MNQKNLLTYQNKTLHFGNYSIKEVIENTLLQLYTIFYEVCRLSEEKEIIKSSLEISKSRLERNKTKFEFGQSTKLELLNAEVDVNTDSIRYLNAVKNLSNAIGYSAQILNESINNNNLHEKLEGDIIQTIIRDENVKHW